MAGYLPKRFIATFTGLSGSYEVWEGKGGRVAYIRSCDSPPDMIIGDRAWVVYTSMGSSGSWFTVIPFKSKKRKTPAKPSMDKQLGHPPHYYD